jgi:flagellar biosynthesis protein FliP
MMNSICEIAQQALRTGYLTLEAENKLRQLLSKKYGREDFRAFMRLQREAMEGRVKQESREVLCYRQFT